MFMQVATGRAPDPAEFQRLGELWDEQVAPVAEGYLGSTAGLTDDGRFVVASRWESAEAAAANNERPEQLAWFEELQKAGPTDVEYHDCTQIITLLGGGSDDAGFVQVMVGRIKDRAKFDALSAKSADMERVFSAWRDDVLGEVMAVHGDGDGYHDIIYFRSEAEARAGERKQPTAEVQALMAEMDEAAEIVAYLDLRDPVMR
jgi:hypothetical protein